MFCPDAHNAERGEQQNGACQNRTLPERPHQRVPAHRPDGEHGDYAVVQAGALEQPEIFFVNRIYKKLGRRAQIADAHSRGDAVSMNLAEALDLLKPGKHMQIELKGNDKNLLPALKTVLEQWKGNKAQLALSSFEKETIQSAGVFFPELPRLLLTDLKTEFGSFPSAAQVSESMKSLNCTGVSFKADRSASREFVNQLHANGLRVVCWGVSSDELGIAMAELGVDAMTSNHAVALRRIWREKQS